MENYLVEKLKGETKAETLMQPRGNIDHLEGESEEGLIELEDTTEGKLEKVMKLLKETQLAEANLKRTLARHLEKKTVFDRMTQKRESEELFVLKRIEENLLRLTGGLPNSKDSNQNSNDWLTVFLTSFKKNERNIEYLLMWFAKTFDYFKFCSSCSEIRNSQTKRRSPSITGDAASNSTSFPSPNLGSANTPENEILTLLS